MPYHVSVYKPHNKRPFPDDDEAIEMWIFEEEKHALFSYPLGATETINKLWYGIGLTLKLSLISQIYDYGIEICKKLDLELLKDQVLKLREYWESHELDDSLSVNDENGKVGTREHLIERSNFLLEAIEIAINQSGILIIY